MAAPRNIMVTGGNAGIGLALCAQLLVDHNARVFMGTRDPAKGEAALKELDLPTEAAARCSVVQIDVTSADSITAAVAAVTSSLGDQKLYGLVNNAGIGLSAHASGETMLNTNLYGSKRVSEAFVPLLDPAAGRIVMLGSGAAGMYVKGLGETDAARTLCKDDVTWTEIEAHVKEQSGGPKFDKYYGLSKAALASYTKILAREHPKLMVSCCSPGFIDTKLTKGFGAKKSPAEGTPAIKKLLFEQLSCSGWYYGSDGIRSPYHVMRNPGAPEYDGKIPF